MFVSIIRDVDDREEPDWAEDGLDKTEDGLDKAEVINEDLAAVGVFTRMEGRAAVGLERPLLATTGFKRGGSGLALGGDFCRATVASGSVGGVGRGGGKRVDWDPPGITAWLRV
jgi:hypothetical protein